MTPRRAHPEGGRTRGAALVEFAIVGPLLILLLFGIMEFGWAFLTNLDIRHAAREGGRLAAVDYDGGGAAATARRNALVAETCLRIDTPEGTTIALAFRSGNDAGDVVEVTASRSYSSLTGFFDFLDFTMRSQVQVRLEQDATYAAGSVAC